jgi:RNA 2',3'-cyclic 3'-phosphodiesterase
VGLLMPEPEHFRLFIALTLPEAVKAEVEQAQAQLRRALRQARVSWTRLEQFHLTLKFLGNVEVQRVDALIAAVRAAGAGFPALRLRAEQLGCFPSLRSPRVAWVGVNDAVQDLPRLQAALETACAGFTSQPAQERFSGHVTLARIKAIGRPEAETLAAQVRAMAGQSFGQWTTDHLDILRSELSPQGARHTVLAETPLLGPATPAPNPR